MPAFSFTVRVTDGAARLGEFQTAHGVVQTPAFMPVGTQGAVKAIRHRDLEEAGAEIFLANTYHLLLRPGDELVARRRGPSTASSAGRGRSSPTAAASSSSASRSACSSLRRGRIFGRISMAPVIC